MGELCIDDGFDEVAERSGVELVSGDLSLELPIVAVGVEDAVAEEIAQCSTQGEALGVDVEMGLEYSSEDGGVGGEDLAGTKRTVEGEGGGGRVMEDVGDPLDAAVLVCQNG